MDALEEEAPADQPAIEDVERLLDDLGQIRWEPAPPLGLGNEFRTTDNEEIHASVLVVDGTVVHGSVATSSRDDPRG